MTQAPGLSTIQAAVQITQNIVQCGINSVSYGKQIGDLHALMSDWAVAEIKANGFAHATLELATAEDNEATPMAEAYWAATSAFFRKVYQACASAA